jgi:hypothetical protein
MVFGAVIGGFLMEHGKMPVLIQPAELLIIGGSAIGTLLVANSLPLIIKIFKSLIGIPQWKPFLGGFLSGESEDVIRYLSVCPEERDGKARRGYRESGQERRFFEVSGISQRPSRSSFHLRYSPDFGGWRSGPVRSGCTG